MSFIKLFRPCNRIVHIIAGNSGYILIFRLDMQNWFPDSNIPKEDFPPLFKGKQLKLNYFTEILSTALFYSRGSSFFPVVI